MGERRPVKQARAMGAREKPSNCPFYSGWDWEGIGRDIGIRAGRRGSQRGGRQRAFGLSAGRAEALVEQLGVRCGARLAVGLGRCGGGRAEGA